MVVSSFILEKEKTESKAPSPSVLNFGAPITEAASPSSGASRDSPMRKVVRLSTTNEELFVMLLNQCMVCQHTGAKHCEKASLKDMAFPKGIRLADSPRIIRQLIANPSGQILGVKSSPCLKLAYHFSLSLC